MASESHSFDPAMPSLSKTPSRRENQYHEHEEAELKWDEVKPQSLRELVSFRSNSGRLSKDSFVQSTFAGQTELPRLPIPDLDETLFKFSQTMEALQTKEQQEETERVVKQFAENEGPMLQEALTEYERVGFESGELGSYVEEFWNESYLSPDTSVVLNLNPYFVLQDGADPTRSKDQLKRAAGLVFASIKIASVLRHETLPPDIVKGKPLCMDQFKALFGASRQPAIGSADEVHVYNGSCHVVVLCRNQFYYFPALWPDSGHVAVDESDILEILKGIKKHAHSTISQEEATHSALGVFTSLKRSQWAVTRRELCKLERNENGLNIVDSGLFVLVLDDDTPADIHKAAANMLHGTNRLAEGGDTLQVGTCLNRWYDKLQLIVCEDGTAGVNFEHSAIDGHTALRFVSDMLAETVIAFAESIVDLVHGRGRIQHVVEAEVIRAAVTLGPEGLHLLDVYPRKIVFDIPEKAMQRIYYAETALCDEVVASDTYVLEFNEFGKSLIVGNKMSPDSFVQMSIMIAYYKLYGKIVCTYEPVMTKSFFHGRTEAMRSATPEAKALCKMWSKKSATDKERLSALRVATIEHSRLVKEAALGQGVDRHLFSLKCIAARMNMPTPPFFESEAWKQLNHTILSTSNCGNPSLRLFGFGPVVSDGFGVGYIIKDNGLSFSVSSKHRQTQRYVRSLNNTLKEMQALLKPIASMVVDQRHSIRHMKPMSQEAKARAHVSLSAGVESGYDDVYGENSAPAEIDTMGILSTKGDPSIEAIERRRRMLKRQSSSFLKTVKPRNASFDFFESPDMTVKVDLADLDDDTETTSSALDRLAL